MALRQIKEPSLEIYARDQATHLVHEPAMSPLNDAARLPDAAR